MKRLICAFAGHRWQEADDEHESYGVLRCARCGKHMSLAGQEVGQDRMPASREL